MANSDVFSDDLAYYTALTGNNESRKDAAWQHLYEKHRDFITRLLNENNPALQATDENIKDAEDAYHEGLIAVISAITKGRMKPGKNSITRYLYSCCQYSFWAIRRKKSRYFNTDSLPESTDITTLYLQEQEKKHRTFVDTIKEAINALRKGCTDTLTAFLLNHDTIEAIAQKKQIDKRSVSNEISRCKEELLKLLKTKYNYQGAGLWS
ncbi:MAG: hypothetical protein QM731_12465 [Chitinophagaceae bacterium]